MRRNAQAGGSSRTDGSHRLDEEERPGGKRAWYADFEPALACTCYALCSISLSLFNKMVFSGSSFNYPISVLAFQSLCAVVFLQISDVLKLSEPSPLTKGARRARARARAVGRVAGASRGAHRGAPFLHPPPPPACVAPRAHVLAAKTCCARWRP